MSLLRLDALTFHYPGTDRGVTGISAVADRGELIAAIGPNGAGKSTLLDLIAGYRTPTSGACFVDGHNVRALPRKELCQKVAHVPQQVPATEAFTVEDVILTGRIPYGAGLYESDADFAAMERALRRTRLEEFRHRPFTALSGGEKQRVLLAAAICQEAPILLLDEPSAHLDPENQAQLWELLAALRNDGQLVVMVTHHLALAAQHSDRIWLLDHGRLAADAAPREAMGTERLERIFHVPFHWHQSAEGRVFLTYGW